MLPSVSKLTAGALVSQVAVVATAPVLSRLYPVEAFGVFGTYTAIIAILTPLATGRLEVALPVAEEQYRGALLRLSRRLNIAVCLAAGLAGLVLAPLLGLADDISESLVAAALLALGVHSVAIYNVRTYSRLAETDYRTTALAHGANGVMSSAAKVAAFLASASPIGLISGTLIGQYGAALIARAPKRQRSDDPRSISEAVAKYSDFLRWNLPEALTSIAGTQIPILLISFFFGAGPTGWYFMANRLLQLPMALLGQSITKVFLLGGPERTTTRAAIRASALMLACGLGFSLLLSPIAPDVFAMVLGEDWRPAGEMARWLAFWSSTALALTPVHGRAVAERHQRLLFGWSLGKVIVRSAALAIAAMYGGLLAAVVALAITGTLMNLASHASLVRRLTGERPDVHMADE